MPSTDPTSSPVARLFDFPNPVNEVSTRLVASAVVVMAVVAIAARQGWLLPVMAYGFVARAAAGPRLSPLALLVTRVVTPALGLAERPVAGPPKRFAQAIGAVFTLTATILLYGFGLAGAAYVLVGVLAACAFLEAAFGLCIACRIFALGMKLHIVPEEVCADCADIWARQASPAT